jgi:hypothetical protein
MNDVMQPVKLTFSGGLSFERDITLGQAGQILAFLDTSGPATSTSAPVLALASTSPSASRMIGVVPGSTMSNPREALEASGAKTNAEKIVAFALYVGQDGGKDTFTMEDIKPLFRRARETAPGNFSRDLAVAIRAGWVTESDTNGEYYVTGKAAQVFEHGFEGLRQSQGNGSKTRQVKARTSGSKATRKAAAKPVPEAFKDVEAIESTIEGYGNYHKLKKKADKLLWAVNAAKLLGVPSVTNQDIVWLTDQLGEGIATSDITAYYRLNSKPGYVNRTLQEKKIRITPTGEEYLKSLED